MNASGYAVQSAFTIYSAWLLALAGFTAVWLTVWAARRRMSCMAGMMTAMALGMTVGLLSGAWAGVSRPSDLWWATWTGSAAGIAAGAFTGAMVSLMALLDGALSGLMGGMMGAMLGVMAPQKASVIMVAGAWVALVCSVLLIVLTAREAGTDYLLERLRGFARGRIIRQLALLLTGAAALLLLAPISGTPIDEKTLGHADHGAQIREISLSATNAGFSRSVITLKAGERVRLRLVNSDQTGHDLTIPGLNFYAHTDPGETAAAELVPKKPGTYRAFCSSPGHREQGMSLQIVVN